MKPFFSILIPIYNVEQYLEQCLESLLNQSFDNLQIICINDGSTDNSSAILNAYSNRDSRISILNQTNRGYGFSLNRGMQYVEADYISIIEPDDFIDINAYKSFYKETMAFPQADIIKYAYWNFHEDTCEKKTEPSSSSFFRFPEKPFKISQYPQLLLYHPSIWSCIYKSSFLKKYNLSFIEAPGAGWTDNPFLSPQCVLPKILYGETKNFIIIGQGIVPPLAIWWNAKYLS